MSRKNIYVIIIIVVNLLVFTGLYLNSINEIYTDELAEKAYVKLDKSSKEFFDFIEHKTNKFIGDIASKNFPNEEELRNYFEKDLDSKLFSSVILIKGNKVFYFKHENQSIITAYDSSKVFSKIQMHRYKKQKLIGSWRESVIVSRRMQQMFKDTKTKPQSFHWIMRQSNNSNSNILRVGYYDSSNDFFVFIDFNQENFADFFDNLKLLPKKKTAIITKDNKIIVHQNDSLYSKNKYNDLPASVVAEAVNRSMAFENDSIHLFSFVYSDSQAYWVLMDRINRLDIKTLIMVIPNESLKEMVNVWNMGNIIIEIIILLLSIILIFLIIKKEDKKRKPLAVSHLKTANSDTIQDLLKQNESRYLEFKSSMRWDYRQNKENADLESIIIKTIAAFGNSDGGNLIIGVDDDKNILGLEKDFSTLKKADSDYYEIYLRNLFHKYFGVKYTTENIRVAFPVVDGKEICLITVAKAKEPAYVKINKKGRVEEKFYVRSGNSSIEISSLKEINDYIFERFNSGKN